MVELLRVDERLLHGQVAVTWVSNLDITSILIANDDVVTNEMSKMALKMAKPTGINLAIRSIDEGAALLNDPRVEKSKVLVLVKTVQDASRLIEKINEKVDHVNIGGIKRKEGSKLIAPAVYVNEDDVNALNKLIEMVDKVEFRMVPSENAKSAESIIKNF
ncbi:PTS system mannose/fructose/N-acetylgalactosamine-transporter subunit IIB [Breznakia pachnodae]|uniref:Mannose/fructose/N-acetylgalactosamine-specific phosphotransferase system component IIB n=1 Tax=Breznakia pachnodae TaxID=265178 RepID=A0ABU0DZZ4_9FIRM|nr:PTS sugar transporter subunit IIB [Breznakia pachnodae]MDQ0360120.1 mannose/fructose/N-acetylgalactosamine-specific phosphotransferase system component IIB [Breznakia pachnodae]